jgi:1-pyrroline-4-hydroxy-2-carboxylate deaminase
MTLPDDLSGVHAALTTPFDATTGRLDLDALETHVAWLVGNGVDGLVPDGSLGEHGSMDRDERRTVVETVARVAKGRTKFIVDVSATSWRIAGEHARHAADIGADAVSLLPPTNHFPTSLELIDHYRSVAQYGLPVIIHNDPSSTRIDLTPTIVAQLGELDGIAAVVDSSGDIRRLSEIAELAPNLELLCGSDDLVLESALMGATGSIGGFTGVLPREMLRVFELGRLGDLATAVPLYRAMLPLLRWGSTARHVEAIKHAIDLLELTAGGPPRPPRRVLEPEDARTVARQLARVQAASSA